METEEVLLGVATVNAFMGVVVGELGCDRLVSEVEVSKLVVKGAWLVLTDDIVDDWITGSGRTAIGGMFILLVVVCNVVDSIGKEEVEVTVCNEATAIGMGLIPIGIGLIAIGSKFILLVVVVDCNVAEDVVRVAPIVCNGATAIGIGLIAIGIGFIAIGNKLILLVAVGCVVLEALVKAELVPTVCNGATAIGMGLIAIGIGLMAIGSKFILLVVITDIDAVDEVGIIVATVCKGATAMGIGLIAIGIEFIADGIAATADVKAALFIAPIDAFVLWDVMVE